MAQIISRSRREFLAAGAIAGVSATVGCLGSLVGNSDRVNWKFQASDYIRASIPTTDVLYAVSFDNHLYGIEKSIGSQQWAYETPGEPLITPLLVDDNILIGGNHRFPELVAVSVNSHTSSWKVQTGPMTNSSPVHDGELIYIGNDDGVLYAVNAATGSVQWTRQLPDRLGVPIVLPDAVLVSTNNGTLYAVSKSGEGINWKYELKSEGVPGLERDSRRNIVYAFDYWEGSSHIDAIDGSTGEVLWTKTRNDTLANMKVDQDNYYLLNGAGSLSAFSKETDEGLWNTSVEGTTFGFSIVEDRIYLPSGVQDAGVTPSLHVLSKDSGEEHWQFELPVDSSRKQEEDFIVEPPLVDAEMLFFGTYNGMLYSLHR